MALKACIYFGCENYFSNKIGCSKFTLFQFPKDPDIRAKWMKLGKVPENSPPNLLYFCSDHFDPKYLSINPRRKLLFSSAIPFDCNKETPEDIPIGDDEVVDPIEYRDELFSEEETVQSKFLDESIDNNKGFLQSEKFDSDGVEQILNEKSAVYNIEPIQINVSSTSNPESLNRKHKLIRTTTKQPNIKRVAIKIVPENVIEYIDEDLKLNKTLPNENDHNETNLINSEEITTFIFKNMEYVQMPKEYYVQEKVTLLNKIKKYEQIFKSIKQKLNTL